MPHRSHHYRRHHTHRSRHTNHPQHPIPVVYQTAPPALFRLPSLPLDLWQNPWEMALLGVLLLGGCVKLVRSLAYQKIQYERWSAAHDMRRRAVAEEHVADSVIRMLSAREKVARASTSMYNATVDTYGARVRALESQRFLEAVASGTLTSASLSSTQSSPLLLAPVSTTASRTGSSDQSTITTAALRAVIENGTDMSDWSVQQAWNEWTARIRREHSSQTASAIIDAAQTLVREAN